MKRKFTNKASNAVEPAAPASIWCKGVPGKGGMTTNTTIIQKEKENV